MTRSNYYHWIKLQRRYRNVQAKLTSGNDSRLSRKLDIIARRLYTLNRRWKLGIATSVLAAWLAYTPPTLQAQVFSASLNASSLSGTNGFIFNGVDANDDSGFAVSNAGDINGDGMGDLVIGAPDADPCVAMGNMNSGTSYVVFGSTGGFSSPFELSSISGSTGFLLDGYDDEVGSGTSIANLGDVNGDGIDDLAIGAPYGDYGGKYSGEVYVVFGNSGGFTSPLVLSSSISSNDGFMISGPDSDMYAGEVVGRAGDLNGDGLNDIAIGVYRYDANSNNYSGRTFVIFGNSNLGSTIELSDFGGPTGFMIDGVAANDQSGSAVGSAGDINNDGIDDLLIGADGVSSSDGAVYVVFGNSNGFSSELELSSLNGSNGFVINAANNNDQLGKAVNAAGDINGDGINDMLMGAQYADPNGAGSGAAYVIFGKESFSNPIELSSLGSTEGFTINGESGDDHFGFDVSPAGDVNGDGQNDIIIGAKYADPVTMSDRTGAAYVIFGNSGGFSSPLEASSLNGSNGFAINGEDPGDEFGHSVGSADINKDGLTDVIIGAPYADPNDNNSSGSTYVIFGIKEPLAPVVSNSITDQTATEDQAFSFVVPSNSFSDPNPLDSPTLSAALADGSNLPAWLSFDASTGTFSGTPSDGDVGTISVRVTATDVDNLSANDIFNITINGVNDAPVLASISDQTIPGGTEFTFTITASDSDLPAQALTFSLDQASIDVGMSIDASTGVFRWSPLNAQQGGREVTVTVSDGTVSDSQTFTITVSGVTGIDDNSLSEETRIYPNPARGAFNLSMQNHYVGAIQVKLINLTGQVFLEQEIMKTRENLITRLDVSGLNSGIYLVELAFGEGNTIIQRFIKE